MDYGVADRCWARCSVVEQANEIKRTCSRKRELMAVILLDVKNAFNSLPWHTVLGTLRERQLPAYLLRVVSAYLKDKAVTIQGVDYPMTAGVPQESILVPLLWNTAYDGVLRIKGLLRGVGLLAYADDLTLTMRTTTVRDLQDKANNALSKISG